MNGEPVLFGLLPHDVTAAAYLFRCLVCGRTRAHEPETLCDGCAKPARRPTATRRRRAKAAT